MDRFALTGYDWGSVPFRSQSLFNLKNVYEETTSASNLQWIYDLSQFAKAGYLQLTIVVASFLVIVRYLLHRPYSKVSKPEGNAHAISWPFELCSQLLRASSLAFMIVAATRGEGRWTDATALAYAFILGVLRLVSDLEWRHVALHHVNFVLASSLLVLAVEELLPYIDVGHNENMSPMLICSISTLVTAILVALATRREWIPPSLNLDISEKMSAREPSPEETCSWLEYYVTYEWLTPLMLRGARRQVTLEELPRLPWYDEPLYLLTRIHEARRKGKSTFWTLFYFLPTELTAMGCWIALCFIFEMIAPFAMYKLLGYLSDTEGSPFRPWVWLILLFVGPLSRSVCFQQYIFTSTRLVVRVKAALTQELYYKAMDSMELDDEVFAEIAATGKEKEKGQQGTTSTGRLANLMGADVDAITRGRDILLVICGIPSGSIVALIGLYKLLGWSALVGIAAMIVLSPLPVLIGGRMVGIQRDMKRIQDSRISVISEYLASIRAIKYFAWEDAIIKRVNEIRHGEQKKIWSLNMLYVALNQLTEAIPTLSLVLIFTLQVLVRKEPLTADVAFTSITLVRTLRRNLSMVSNMSRGFTAAGVSIKRLDRYFDNTTPLRSHPVGPLQIKDATFRRNKKASFALKNISIDFVEGGLNVVTGQSGSGKSTLLMSILGETILEGGTITCPKDIAYASQSPWLQNETIRENILFNSPFEQVRYDRVVNACGLPIDLDEFPERDGTEVGENGASLSGGQKSRVALARALYSKASVILLDDVFSALDAKTSALLWKEAFCGDLLKGRTVVLVTQLPWIAPQADLALTFENGLVKDVQQNFGVVRKTVTLTENLVDEGNVDVTAETAASHATETNGSTANGRNGNGNIKTTEDKRRDEVTQEALKTGPTARLQFFQYMRLFGNPFYAMIAIAMSILSTASFVGTGLWIAVWVDAYGRDDAYNVAFYLGIYAVWSLADIFFSGLTYIAYENGGWFAARSLHTTFMNAVMRVPLSWYKSTPIGRIVNRFSRDLDSIDNMLAGMLRLSLEMLIRFFFQIAAVGSVLPIFMLPAAACCIVGILAGELYTRTAVAIKRLVSSSQSPLFAQFADSLAGLSVIRARANMPQIFGDQLAERLRAFEKSCEAQFNCNRWVALKVDMMTTIVTVAAGAIAVSQAGLVAAGLVGFSLTNATTLSQLILILVRAGNELEVELQSFHRVREYAAVEPEEKLDEYKKAGEYSDNPETLMPKNWPTSGDVEFRNVTIKYDLDGPEILKNINLKFAAGERVAVVGRTGSGKSTLVLSLLRFTNIISGQIIFDGVDITKFPRRKLREALTIIPQEAVLFNGDVRSNLDPTGTIPTEVLEKALQYCSGIASFQHHDNEDRAENGHAQLNETDGTNSDESTGNLGITLSTPVKPKGENFSHGQRQVLSLCRALVRKSKLMLLDEATASMDYETDQGIQEVLRKELNEHGRDRTLVTIAHRLKTIIDYDRVVVMSTGSVLEVGSPKELYEAKGQFYDMMKHSGEFEDLEKFLLDTKE
ncbi:ABC transporter [Hypoxylon crocopeplum]|nr:ABC transporter [Hypoxylon crocopeplum]